MFRLNVPAQVFASHEGCCDGQLGVVGGVEDAALVAILVVLDLRLAVELGVLPAELMPTGGFAVMTKLCQLPVWSAQHCAALVRPKFCIFPRQFWPEYMRIWTPRLNMVLSTACAKLRSGWVLLWHSSSVPILIVWAAVVQQPSSPKRLRVTTFALIAGEEALHVATADVLVEVDELTGLVVAVCVGVALLLLELPSPIPTGIFVVMARLCHLPL